MPVMQWRDENRDYGNPVKEILAEMLAVHQLVHGEIGGAQDADIHGLRLVAADLF